MSYLVLPTPVTKHTAVIIGDNESEKSQLKYLLKNLLLKKNLKSKFT